MVCQEEFYHFFSHSNSDSVDCLLSFVLVFKHEQENEFQCAAIKITFNLHGNKTFCHGWWNRKRGRVISCCLLISKKNSASWNFRRVLRVISVPVTGFELMFWFLQICETEVKIEYQLCTAFLSNILIIHKQKCEKSSIRPNHNTENAAVHNVHTNSKSSKSALAFARP